MKNIISKNSNIIGNYAPFPIDFVYGDGVWLVDVDKKKYLDCGSGVAVSSLGHGNKALTEAISKQAGKVIHTSNWYLNSLQEQLAAKLIEHTGKDYQCFFCNSGAEAVEASIKMARRFFFLLNKGKKECNKLITLKGSFHGRTIATISASNNFKHTEGFEPLLDGFIQVDEDIDTIIELLKDKSTMGIMLESIRGEAGIRPLAPDMLRAISAICNRLGKILIADEVQSGAFRSGRFWAYQHSGVQPHIIASAKGLGGGMPIGCLIANKDIAKAFSVGSHGSTFGGNYLAMAAGIATINELEKHDKELSFFKKGVFLYNELQALKQKYSIIHDSKGIGLMQGVEFIKEISALDVLEKLHEKGLLLIPAGNNSLRWLPPLIISIDELRQALKIFEDAIKEMLPVSKKQN